MSDTTIKAKSIKGFNTAASKIIENKFILEEETKELLEDWDSRTVKSVMEFHENQGDLNCCKFIYYTFLKINQKIQFQAQQ